MKSLRLYQIASLSFIILFLTYSEISAQKKPNILFICVDDLRTELGAYGNNVIQTPNLDKLSSQGRLFNQHFVQVPTCGSSRHALLTGMRPRNVAEVNNNISAELSKGKVEQKIPETFAHHFKRNGYYTVGIGKISHHPDGYVYPYEGEKSNQLELPFSWDEMLCDIGGWGTAWNAFFGYAGNKNRTDQNKQVKPYESADVEDNGYPDGLNAKLAIRKLNELKDREEPFLMAVGFFKPHLPFTAPKKYWDLYDRNDIPLSPNPFVVENSKNNSLHKSNELNQYALGEEKAALGQPLSDDYTRKLRHGYYACVSYIDTQIGNILDELEKTGLADNTIVVVWGDHGWHLGDHTVWGKHTVFERSLKSTLIMRIPDQKNIGKPTNSIIESVDIYPTLAELCGIPAVEGLDGNSFVSVLNDPEEQPSNIAFGYFKKSVTLRNNDYRLIKNLGEDNTPIELFDHKSDPNETVNIASKFPKVVELLLPTLENASVGF